MHTSYPINQTLAQGLVCLEEDDAHAESRIHATLVITL